MLKGTTIINRPRVYHQLLELQRAGKTESEIAELLGLTPATLQYVVSLNLAPLLTGYQDRDKRGNQRLQTAYEMWQAGTGFAAISQQLQVSTFRVRQMVHRYGWILRHSK